MEITDVVDQAGAIIAIAAGIGILLLLPLYLSQRRDLKRLVDWMDSEPEHPVADTVASEQILDRAEAELERLTGEQPAVVAEPSGAAARVTSERPALERVTMERAALLPHPRWRRFRDRVTQPRWLAAIAAGAVLLAVAGIFGSQLLLETDEGPPKAARVDTSEVSVAVLNGTTVPGLGQKVGDDVEANAFSLGAVTTFPDPVDQTVVMFERGFEQEASRLSAKLGALPVQPIDRQAQRLADGADVVVIAGQDRAAPNPGAGAGN
jgi:LytR cell envelope-related transcriptional attenuator